MRGWCTNAERNATPKVFPLAQAKSLREISDGLAVTCGKLSHLGLRSAPAKSTLSYANAHRPWQLYQKAFFYLRDFCRSQNPGKKRRFRFKDKLLSLDSTTVDLCLSLFPWAAYEVVEDRFLPQRSNVRADQSIRFTGPKTSLNYPGLLRRVVVWDHENHKEIELLTNHLSFGATTIGRIYRDRWEIELFFKVLKQHLKIKTFVGTSPNALKTQICSENTNSGDQRRCLD